MEEIVVVGKQPGPPMWQVSKGDHELWIFGTLSPLPGRMIWESYKVEDVIARSQEYLAMGGARSGMTPNPFKFLSLARRIKRSRENPGGAMLKDILPEDLYSRFSKLKSRYAPRDKKIEKLRPRLAASELFTRAIEANGLTNKNNIDRKIRKLIKRNKHLKTTEIFIDENLDNTELNKMMTEQENISLKTEITCLKTTIESLESDLDGMKSRANSWALGYVDGLRRFDYPDRRGACSKPLLSTEFVGDTAKRLKSMWLDAAEQALGNNHTTFATLGIDQLLRPDGLLEQLRVKGYKIKAP